MGQGECMMVRYSEHDGTYYHDYESIDEVIEHLDMPRPSDAENYSRFSGASESWDLGLGYDGALSAYTGGWAEGAQLAYELAERCNPKPMNRRMALRRSVAGGIPNVGAYLAGAPDAMYQVTKQVSKGKPYVHLHLPIGYLAKVDATTAFNQGCAMVAVVDALESAGCRVKVTLMRVTQLRGHRFQLRGHRFCAKFEVKDYGDRLDIDQIIFTGAHPAFYRRLIFALQERSEFRGVRTGRYGSTCDPEEYDMDPDPNAILVLFPTLYPNKNGTSPEQFLRDMVAALPEEIQTEIEG